MVRTYTYACPSCRHTVERGFRVPSFIRACANDCGFDHHVRTDLLAKVAEVPETDRPDDWEQLSQSERLMVALKAGVLSLPDLR